MDTEWSREISPRTGVTALETSRRHPVSPANKPKGEIRRLSAPRTDYNGYNYDGGPMSWPSDTGLVSRSAWDRSTGKLYVSGGSHAGHVHENRHLSVRRVGRAGADLGIDAYALASGHRPPAKPPRRLTVPAARTRWTPASRLTLIPIETLSARALATRFAVTPPWEKPVYTDPEDRGT